MKKLSLLLTTFALAFLGTSEACTGIKLASKDGSVINGRTLEFGVVVDVTVAVIPRNFAFKGATQKGPGLPYTSKYAAVGAFAFGNPVFMDGLNEKGLAVGTFYFPTFAKYTELTPENQSKAISQFEFANWVLTQFATIEEVKAGLENIVIAPIVIKEWGPEAAPFHYIVYEKNGRAITVEPLNGKLVVTENKIGTFTNSPTIDWHLTNLRNYINLTPFNAKPVTLNGVTLEPFGEGSGMVGIPGDFTPPSRFVRAAIYSTTAIPSETNNEAVYQMFHILNQFDIPLGAARSKVGDVVYSDSTLLTCVKDPETLKYYFRSYNDQAIKVVDLKAFDLNAKAIKSLNVSGESKALDVSAQLK